MKRKKGKNLVGKKIFRNFAPAYHVLAGGCNAEAESLTTI